MDGCGTLCGDVGSECGLQQQACQRGGADDWRGGNLDWSGRAAGLSGWCSLLSRDGTGQLGRALEGGKWENSPAPSGLPAQGSRVVVVRGGVGQVSVERAVASATARDLTGFKFFIPCPVADAQPFIRRRQWLGSWAGAVECPCAVSLTNTPCMQCAMCVRNTQPRLLLSISMQMDLSPSLPAGLLSACFPVQTRHAKQIRACLTDTPSIASWHQDSLVKAAIFQPRQASAYRRCHITRHHARLVRGASFFFNFFCLGGTCRGAIVQSRGSICLPCGYLVCRRRR